MKKFRKKRISNYAEVVSDSEMLRITASNSDSDTPMTSIQETIPFASKSQMVFSFSVMVETTGRPEIQTYPEAASASYLLFMAVCGYDYQVVFPLPSDDPQYLILRISFKKWKAAGKIGSTTVMNGRFDFNLWNASLQQALQCVYREKYSQIQKNKA